MFDFFKELIEGKKEDQSLYWMIPLRKSNKGTEYTRTTLKMGLIIQEEMTSTDDHLDIPLEVMIKNIEQTVIMVGQFVNCLVKRRAKTTIRKQSQLLERMDADLFGIGFCKHIIETAKAEKESEEERSL